MSFFAVKEFSISSWWLQTYSLLLPIAKKELDYFSRRTCNCSWQRTEPREWEAVDRTWVGDAAGRGQGDRLGGRDSYRALESQRHRDAEKEENGKREQERKTIQPQGEKGIHSETQVEVGRERQERGRERETQTEGDTERCRGREKIKKKKQKIMRQRKEESERTRERKAAETH